MRRLNRDEREIAAQLTRTELPSAGIVVKTAGAAATVGVRRFGLKFQQLGTLAVRAQAVLRVKPDLAPQPWHVQIASGAPVTVCGLGG